MEHENSDVCAFEGPSIDYVALKAPKTSNGSFVLLWHPRHRLGGHFSGIFRDFRLDGKRGMRTFYPQNPPQT